MPPGAELPRAPGRGGRGSARRHERRGRLRERRGLRARARALGGSAPRCIAINAEPDGKNINDGCGALYPEVVAGEVVATGADAGVSHDGDADRALFADAAGSVVDGDQVLAACAIAMHEDGELPGDTVVTTVMANLGFHHAMREAGIDVVSAKVGDRYVLEEMVQHERGARRRAVGARDLPGAGHDRRRAAHRGAVPLARGPEGRPVRELAAVMRRYPQVINVDVARERLDGAREVWVAVRADRGRARRPAGCWFAPRGPSRWSA